MRGDADRQRGIKKIKIQKTKNGVSSLSERHPELVSGSVTNNAEASSSRLQYFITLPDCTDGTICPSLRVERECVIANFNSNKQKYNAKSLLKRSPLMRGDADRQRGIKKIKFDNSICQQTDIKIVPLLTLLRQQTEKTKGATIYLN
jgi:hypothetical protein